MTSAGLYAFADSLGFAESLGQHLQLDPCPVTRHQFPDGESLVRIPGPSRAEAILVRSLYDPNAKLVETLLTADALRRHGSRHLTLVCPYLPYMRQDRVFEPGQPVSQHVVAQLLGGAFDAVVTVEPHLHRIRSLSEIFPCAAQAVSAAPALAQWVLSQGDVPLLVGPDEESEPWVREMAQQLDAHWLVGRKQRRGDADVQVELPGCPSVPRALLIDDIVSSGATLASAARGLRAAGVERVGALVVHPLFCPGALEAVAAAGAEPLVSCDTVAHPTNGISVAGLVAKALSGMGTPRAR